MIQARSSLRNLEPTILHWCQLTTLIRNCCRDMAAQGERQLEILTAFAGKKKNSKSENQKTPSLAWMYSQCAAPPKSAEFSLFSRYSGDVSKVPPHGASAVSLLEINDGDGEIRPSYKVQTSHHPHPAFESLPSFIQVQAHGDPPVRVVPSLQLLSTVFP